MSIEKTADLWWRNAVFYCLDVETFYDSNGDGIGDFQGLTQKVDYLADLGVTCLWLMPFFPSPHRDDGYDIADHYAIDPRLGTFGDLTDFMAVATERGLRVIIDLVVNHTSTEHAWFRSARSDRASPHRDFYVWRDEIPEGESRQPVFPDEQQGLWEWDDEAGQYYLHRFYPHQPDLNVADATVRDEIRKIMGFWLAQGLSGFRVDAVPFLLETRDIPNEAMELDPHDYLRELRAFLNRRDGDAILVGEVNLPLSDARKFFGDEDGDEMHMLFNFTAMQRSYLSLAREDARPLGAALEAAPLRPTQSQWGSFVRNHDELTLDQLSKEELHELFSAFGPDPDMQVYDRGLRRRFPPMVDGDPARIRMFYSLMMSLPGAPFLFYGEEIGMGENLEVDGRLAVRTPMQWSNGHHAGFSTSEDTLVRPIVDTEPFGPAMINVRSQETDPNSLLSWFQDVIRARRESPEIGWGDYEVKASTGDGVLAISYRWEDRSLLAVHNLSSTDQSLDIEIEDLESATVRDLLSRDLTEKIEDIRLQLDLEAYAHHWLVIEKE